MSFMLSTDAGVVCALAATFIRLVSMSARPAPYTMYTPPVPPVTMLSVLPVKSGALLAATFAPVVGAGDVSGVARGAWQAAATSTVATVRDGMRGNLISTSRCAARMLAVLCPPPARELGGGHPALLLVGLGDDRRDRDRLAVLADGHVHEIGRGDVDDLAGEHILGVDPDADLHALGADVVHRCPGGDEVTHEHRGEERELVDPRGDHPQARGPAGGRPGAFIDELHDLAAVDVPRGVGIARQHDLGEHRLRRRHRLGGELGHRRSVAPDRPRRLESGTVSVLSREELRAALAVIPPLVEGIDPHTQLQPNGI